MAFDKKAYNRKYAREHRDKMNSATKKWRATHPDEWRERNTRNFKRWAEKNREKYNAYQRAWRAKKKAELDRKKQA